MLTVCGKIQKVSKSNSGKSYSVNVGGTWVHVMADDVEAFKDAIGAGKPIEVRGRTELQKDDQGNPRMRSFKRRDGSTDSAEEISLRYWFVNGSDAELGDLLGVEAKAGAAEPQD